MTRERVAVGEPGPLAGFPVWHVLRGSVLHRVTSDGRGPWWFASGGTGRFDLEAPRGTCYLADDPLVAVLEFLGVLASSPVLDPAVLDDRSLWTVELPEQCDAADLTDRAARRHGVTAELATMTPYALSRRWAAALAAAGFGGIRYRARHDPAGGRCLALFGAAGERRWRRGRRAAVRGPVLDRLQAEAGIVLAEERPSLQALADLRD